MGRLHYVPIVNQAWTQSGSSWSNSQSGVAWSTGGMAAGVEYKATPISSTTINSRTTEVWLDIGHDAMQMNGDHGWIVIASTASGSPAWVEFYSSESNLDYRPKIVMNYTDVNSVSVSPSGSTTDADTQVQFLHILTDLAGSMISEDVVWSVTNGTIDSTGLFTPQLVGSHDVTACFGVICVTESITVTPGSPVTLIVDDIEEEITADETFTISASVEDQHGNTVPGITISYTTQMEQWLEKHSNPYSSGVQTITVGWNSQTIDVIVTVIGAPTYYDTTGCEDVIKAGKTCELNWTLYDQFDNLLDVNDGGGITWTVGGGVFH